MGLDHRIQQTFHLVRDKTRGKTRGTKELVGKQAQRLQVQGYSIRGLAGPDGMAKML